MRHREGAVGVLDGDALVRGREEKGRLTRAVHCCRDAKAPERVCKLFRGLLDLRLRANSLQIEMKTGDWGGREKRCGQLCGYY